MIPILIFIFFFLALGVFALITKLISLLRAPALVTRRDISDLLAYVFLTAFPAACGLLVWEKQKSQSLTPGFELLAAAAAVMAVSLAIRPRAGSPGAGSPAIDPKTLEQRRKIAERILRFTGQDPKLLDSTTPSPPPPPRTIPWLFFVPFLLFGAFGVIHGGVILWQSLQSKNWPHTDGVIASSVIEKHHSSSRHGRSQDVWAVNILYDYQVAGISYHGGRVSFGMVESSEAHAQSFVYRYPPGRHVLVFYSRSDPQNAVLETGIDDGIWIWLGLGGIFFAVGAVGLILRNRKPKKIESKPAN